MHKVTTHLMGAERCGHWSADADGRLRADRRSREKTADAGVAANPATEAISPTPPAGRGLDPAFRNSVPAFGVLRLPIWPLGNTLVVRKPEAHVT
jgi:hypothetical protein